MFYSNYTQPLQSLTYSISYSLTSHLQVSPHLLIGDPKEGLTGPSVAKAACAHVNIV